MADSVDLDEVAHDEPPHQDIRYLQIQLFHLWYLKNCKGYGAAGYGKLSKTYLLLYCDG